MARRFALALLFVVGVVPTAAAQPLPPPVNLPIQNIQQQTGVWCWAAVAQQIIAAAQGPGRTPPQCALVEAANGASPGACCNAAGHACVSMGSMQQIEDLIDRFSGHNASYAPPADAMTIYRSLAAGNPVIMQLNSGPQRAHVIVVRGMSFVQTRYGVVPMLYVNDPRAGVSRMVRFDRIAPRWMSAMVVR